MPKNVQTTTQSHSFHTLAKWCSKSSTWSFNNMWTVKFQMFRLDLEKSVEPEIKLPASTGSLKKQESSSKTSISTLLTMPKHLTMWITTNCGKFWKRWEYQTTWPASWEICMQVRKQQLEHVTTDWFQTGKGVLQGCILLPCLFNLYANTSWETLGWMKQKLESRLLGELSITSDMQMAPPLWQKVKS